MLLSFRCFISLSVAHFTLLCMCLWFRLLQIFLLRMSIFCTWYWFTWYDVSSLLRLILFSVSHFLYICFETIRILSMKNTKLGYCAHLSWLSIFFMFWYWDIVDYASLDFEIVAVAKAYKLIVTLSVIDISIFHVLGHTIFSLMSADKTEISKMHTTTRETVIVIHELKDELRRMEEDTVLAPGYAGWEKTPLIL